MADFWDAATEGFNRGVPLGVRAAERAQEEKYRKSAEERATAQERRAVELFSLQKQEHEQQIKLGDVHVKEADIRTKELEDQQRQKNFKRSVVIASALADTGDPQDDRAAWKLGSEAYNKLVLNGDEMQVIHREDQPNNEIWNKDFVKDANSLVLSRQYGVQPFKNAKDFVKILQGYTDPDKFFEYERTQQAAVSDKNAAEKPFRGTDNKLYVKKWSMTRTGKESKVVPYEGPEPMSEAEQKVRAIKDIPENLLNEEGKKILLGVREKEQVAKPQTPEEKTKTEAETTRLKEEANKAKEEAEKLKREGLTKPLKEDLELTGKKRDQFKKDLELVLKPFSAGGKPVLDFDTGEMTTSGQNALEAAGKLITKHEKTPETLTTDEKRNVQHAYRAWEIYKNISGTVSSGYVKPTSGGWRQYDTPGQKKEEPKRSGAGRGF